MGHAVRAGCSLVGVYDVSTFSISPFKNILPGIYNLEHPVRALREGGFRRGYDMGALVIFA